MISEVLLKSDNPWFCVCGQYLTKGRGGSGVSVKGPVKSWIHRLQDLSPHLLPLPLTHLVLPPMSSQGRLATQTILRVAVTFAENCPFQKINYV